MAWEKPALYRLRMAKKPHNRTITEADKRAAARLRRLWDERAEGLGVTQDAIAATMDRSQGLISQYLTGRIALNYRAVLAFANALKVDPEEIRNDLSEQRMVSVPRIADSSAEYLWSDIRAYAQAVGMGNGPEADEYAESHKLKFRADALARKRLRPTNLCVMYAVGDSMLPRIHPGDAVLFDTSDTRPQDGKIFVLSVPGAQANEYTAKRCEIIDDMVFFKADNPDGDHGWKKPKRMDNKRHPITIIGRVRWFGSWED